MQAKTKMYLIFLSIFGFLAVYGLYEMFFRTSLDGVILFMISVGLIIFISIIFAMLPDETQEANQGVEESSNKTSEVINNTEENNKEIKKDYTEDNNETFKRDYLKGVPSIILAICIFISLSHYSSDGFNSYFLSIFAFPCAVLLYIGFANLIKNEWRRIILFLVTAGIVTFFSVKLYQSGYHEFCMKHPRYNQCYKRYDCNYRNNPNSEYDKYNEKYGLDDICELR